MSASAPEDSRDNAIAAWLTASGRYIPELLRNRFPPAFPTFLSAILAAGFATQALAAERTPVPTRDADVALHDGTELSTAAGTRFMVPAGWMIERGADVTWLMPPDNDAWIAVVDARGATAEAALDDAWSRLGRSPGVAVRLATTSAPRDGWTHLGTHLYDTPAAENRLLRASVFGREGAWTVFVAHMSLEVADRRRSQLALIGGRILPPGQARESFEGRTPRAIGAHEIGQLNAFIAEARTRLRIPGVAMGLLQDGRVVYAGGQGVREQGKPEPVDEKTLFLVASNTKAMTTMMLARLVDAGRLQWERPVKEVWPAFRLGSEDASKRVEIRHLVCACTGLPRQDYPWLMEFAETTPEDVVARLRDVVPTTAFGELYQYSNALAAAGGYVGAHLAHPEQPLGTAYDRLMQDEVFDPLGMHSTTFDFDRALAVAHASPHAQDVQGHVSVVDMARNRSILPLRPAGGAWSNVDDMLRFVGTELTRGKLQNGGRYVSAAALTARWEPQVALGADASYGMGLMTDRSGGVTSVQHGGSMLGYQTGMLWLPDHGVGIVLLTNADNGAALMGLMRRRLLEILFDGEPLAAQELVATAARLDAAAAAAHRGLRLPADGIARTLVGDYRNAELGPLQVRREGERTFVDFGEWRSEVAIRHEAGGAASLVTVAPGAEGYEFIVEASPTGPRLVLLEAQHRYVFEQDRRAAAAVVSTGARR